MQCTTGPSACSRVMCRSYSQQLIAPTPLAANCARRILVTATCGVVAQYPGRWAVQVQSFVHTHVVLPGLLMARSSSMMQQ